MRFQIFLIYLFLSIGLFSQKAYQITTLSKSIGETSGLLFIDGSFYTFNDSGGESELYQIDTITGEVSKTIKVEGAKNKDWEAITSDGEFIYIGDIGNNWGNRKDLVIYKCPVEGLYNGVLSASKIYISYEDQESFKHKPHQHEYDGEALFVRGNKLYLVSKNWTKDESKIYEVPKSPGTYELEYEEVISVKGKVTDAFYSDEYESLFLIGYGEFTFITLLKGFDGKKASLEVTLPTNSPNALQTEAVVVVGNKVFYTSEEVEIFSAELARFFLKDFNQLVEINVKGTKIKVNAVDKIEKITVEKKKGKNLLQIEGVNSKSKSISTRSFEGEKSIYIKVKLENGAVFRQQVSIL